MKFVYWAFVAIMIVVAVLLALSNQNPIEVGIWPLPYLSMPAYVVVLGAFAIGFLSGGFLFWLRAIVSKARELRTGRRADRLQRELDDLQGRDKTRNPKEVTKTSVIPAAASSASLQNQSGAG